MFHVFLTQLVLQIHLNLSACSLNLLYPGFVDVLKLGVGKLNEILHEN